MGASGTTRALAIRERVLGPDHPDTGPTARGRPAHATGVAALLVLLVALTAEATQAEYVDAVKCLQPEACINP